MSDNPYFTEQGPHKNLGVFRGDGNKYRFGFDLWTGNKVPGGVIKDIADIYYSFTVGNLSDPSYKLTGRALQCWIKKEVFTAIISEDGKFTISAYASGQLVIWYNDTLMGIIFPSPIDGANGLWGINDTEQINELDYVFDQSLVDIYIGIRTAFLAGGGVEQAALIYTGTVDTAADELLAIQREDQITYSIPVSSETTFTLLPTITPASEPPTVSALYITVPAFFRITDDRVKVANESYSVATQEYAKPPQLSLGLSQLLPHSDIASTGVISKPATSSGSQYLNIEVADPEGTITSGLVTTANNVDVYNENMGSLLLDGETLRLYITLTETLSAEFLPTGVFTGALNHIVGAVPVAPEDNIFNLELCNVKLDTGVYYLKNQNAAYEVTLRGGTVMLTAPFVWGVDDTPSTGDLEHIVTGEPPKALIDLNDIDHQTVAKLMMEAADDNNDVWNIPAEFVNARYYPPLEGAEECMGVIRHPEVVAPDTDLLSYKVGLAGITAKPAPSATDENRVYGFTNDDKWGLFKFEDVELVTPTPPLKPYYRIKKTTSDLTVIGAASETDFVNDVAYDNDAYDPANPPTGKDGVSVIVSLGCFYDDSATTPKLFDYRVTLTWPNVIAPNVSIATAVEIDQPA